MEKGKEEKMEKKEEEKMRRSHCFYKYTVPTAFWSRTP